MTAESKIKKYEEDILLLEDQNSKFSKVIIKSDYESETTSLTNIFKQGLKHELFDYPAGKRAVN